MFYGKMYIKEFDRWTSAKKTINDERRELNARAGEIDGKGPTSTRPVLILHTVGSNLVFVVPMTTKMKVIAGYIPLVWNGRDVALCIHQARIISTRRLLRRMGKLPQSRLQEIKREFVAFYSLQ